RTPLHLRQTSQSIYHRWLIFITRRPFSIQADQHLLYWGCLVTAGLIMCLEQSFMHVTYPGCFGQSLATVAADGMISPTATLAVRRWRPLTRLMRTTLVAEQSPTRTKRLMPRASPLHTRNSEMAHPSP